MAVKVADTIKPMGNFNAVDASDVGVVIEGVGRSLQNVIDAGDLKGVDSIIVPPESERMNSSQNWHIKKIIETCLGSVNKTVFIKPPISGLTSVDSFHTDSFELGTDDGATLYVNGLCDIIKCVQTTTSKYDISFICHNPINLDYNHNYNGQDWLLEPSYYAEITAEATGYNQYSVDVNRWFYLKDTLDGEPESIYFANLSRVGYFAKTCKINKLYDLSVWMGGHVDNFCGGDSLEYETNSGVYVNELMMCTRAIPNRELAFVSLHRNEEDETEFELIRFYNSNWYEEGEPDWKIGWIRNIKYLAEHINSLIQDDTSEYEGKYTHRCDFSNIYGDQVDNSKLCVHFNNVEEMSSFKLEIDGSTMLQKYDVGAGALEVWIHFDGITESATIEWTEDSSYTLHKRRFPYGEVSIRDLEIEFEDSLDETFGPAVFIE